MIRRQTQMIPSIKSAITPACRTVKNPCSSVRVSNTRMKIENNLIQSSGSRRTNASSLMYHRMAKAPMISASKYAMACLLDDLKICLAWILRQRNNLGTLKKMTPRSGESRGVRVGSAVTAPNRMDDAASESKCTPLPRQIQSHPHVSPGFAGFTYETRSRGGITPTGQVADTRACQNYAYECQETGIVPQSPEMVKSTGRRLATDNRQRSYTPHVSPQTVLPIAGRDNGERAFILKELTDEQ